MLIADSVTQLNADAAGRVVLAASHGGVYAVHMALCAKVKGLIVCDAGVGRDCAGVAGLPYAAQYGVPCAAIDYRSARIGDGHDCAARGLISHVNAAAQALGITPGLSARQAAARMLEAAHPQVRTPAALPGEFRQVISAAKSRTLVLIDSASLVLPEDAQAIVITGSHGGLLGGKPETAIRQRVFAALYNDAGVGCDNAGVSRLPALDRMGIAGATVHAWSAHIGSAASAWQHGVISHVNPLAYARGAREGQSAQQWVAQMQAADSKARHGPD